MKAPALLVSWLEASMTYTSAKSTVNELLMMGRAPARNMWKGSCFSQNKLGKLVRLLVLLKRNLLRCTVT
jgi:hypothetical protein